MTKKGMVQLQYIDEIVLDLTKHFSYPKRWDRYFYRQDLKKVLTNFWTCDLDVDTLKENIKNIRYDHINDNYLSNQEVKDVYQNLLIYLDSNLNNPENEVKLSNKTLKWNNVFVKEI